MILSVIIPSRTLDDPQLQVLLHDLAAQDFPKDQVEILVETRGNSEEAKAYAIQRARGDILGFFCTDNRLRDPTFLTKMLWWQDFQGVDGAYTARYDHVPWDKPLSRYFALLGGNDPLCWWLGKNDRQEFMPLSPNQPFRTFTHHIPSIGDNGFFIRRDLFNSVTPNTHFCIDAVEDLRRQRPLTFAVRDDISVWHQSGESLLGYFKRRYRYTKELYWRDYAKRRWRMVSTVRDWALVGGFVLASVLVLPHLWTVVRGYARVRDRAWLFHPVVCLGLTGLYTWLLVEHVIVSFSARWIAPLVLHEWCRD